MKFDVNDINNDLIKKPYHNIGGSKVKLPHQTETDKQKTDNTDNSGKTNNFNKPNIKPIKSSKSHDTNQAIVTYRVICLLRWAVTRFQAGRFYCFYSILVALTWHMNVTTSY